MALDELRQRMRAFVDDVVIPAERSADPDALAALKSEAKARGLWALGHPLELGGGGLSFLDFTLLNEIIGRSHLGQLAVGTVSMQDSIMLHAYGNDEQRARWLEPMVAGEVYPSVGLTEPEVAGSDPTRMQTAAVLDGDEWVIDGHKWFTTGASRAAFTTVFARTEPDGTPDHQAFSAIVVPAGTPGLTIERVLTTMGTQDGDHCELRLRPGTPTPAGCWSRRPGTTAVPMAPRPR